ncbi:MAG: efflux RND transporter periplasmic adaptor subunit [Chlamydiae bacterium]|nr:efflux RND transporter periplasmic adaptor subunit [Chlamydiota bacterium]
MKYKILLHIMPLVLFYGCSKPKPGKQLPTPRVKVTEVKVMPVDITIGGIGHVTAFNSAKICAQVEGYLVDISYTQGQLVQKGDLLITIDPRLYQAELEASQGSLMEAKANKAFSSNKKERYSSLVKDQFVSELDYFQYVCNDQQQDGAIVMNQGEVQKNQVNLDFCYIKAPFSGRCSKKLVDVGNLISDPAQNLMLLNQITPIYIDFSVPEYDFSHIMQMQKKENLDVRIKVPGSNTIVVGKLIVIDNQIDQTTGQIPLRAQYENGEEALWPGQYANCELVLETIQNALMVPVDALGIGAKGKYVIKVDSSNTAKYTWVQTGVQVDKMIQLISNEISAADRVIIQGQINVADGSRVQVL